MIDINLKNSPILSMQSTIVFGIANTWPTRTLRILFCLYGKSRGLLWHLFVLRWNSHLAERHAPATEAPLQLHRGSFYRLPQLQGWSALVESSRKAICRPKMYLSISLYHPAVCQIIWTACPSKKKPKTSYKNRITQEDSSVMVRMLHL